MAERPSLKRKRLGSMDGHQKFPPLPELTGDVHLDVFTHPSLRTNAADTNDNERYQDLGSMALPLIVTHHLFSRQPPLPSKQVQARHPSPHTNILTYAQAERARLLSNDNVATWVAHYKLAPRLRTARNANVDAATNTADAAHLFHAYAGGVYHQQGMARLEAWIVGIIDPAAPPQPPAPASSSKIEATEGTTQAPDGPKPTTGQHTSRIHMQAQAKRAKIDFEYDSIGPPHNPTWTVRLLGTWI